MLTGWLWGLLFYWPRNSPCKTKGPMCVTTAMRAMQVVPHAHAQRGARCVRLARLQPDVCLMASRVWWQSVPSCPWQSLSGLPASAAVRLRVGAHMLITKPSKKARACVHCLGVCRLSFIGLCDGVWVLLVGHRAAACCAGFHPTATTATHSIQWAHYFKRE